MSKTHTTLDMEKAIWNHTKKQGVFGCFEVTIGWFGHERVDYLTFDTKGIWRCYEIKVSKQDFNSNAALTFVGNYNYFVMPQELYETVKDKIPEGVGVYTRGGNVRPAKRRELGAPVDILYQSMIRSMSRDVDEAARARGENSTYFDRYCKKLGERLRKIRQELNILRERSEWYSRAMTEYRSKNRSLEQQPKNVTGNSTNERSAE